MSTEFCVAFAPLLTEQDIIDIADEQDITILRHYKRLGNVYFVDGNVGSLILNENVEFFMANDIDIIFQLKGANRATVEHLPLPADYTPSFTGTNTVCYLIDDNDTHSPIMKDIITTVSPSTLVHNHPIISPTVSSILSCLDAVLLAHSNSPSTVAIINASWTTLHHPFLNAIASAVAKANLLIIASAGISTQPASLFWPAASPTTLTVGATNQYDCVLDTSNHGEAVDIHALADTTSEATAIVSGASLQFIEAHDSYTAIELKGIIIDTAKKDILVKDRTTHSATPNLLLQLPLSDK